MSENSGEWDNKRRNYTRELIEKREGLMELHYHTIQCLEEREDGSVYCLIDEANGK